MRKKIVEKVNKSRLIRDYLKENKAKEQTSKEIAETLTKESGVAITTGYVDNIKYTLKNKRKAAKKGKQAVEIADLIALKDFVEKFGGIDRTKEAFDSLTKILSM